MNSIYLKNQIQPKVSVIVPIYKAEKYLERCLISLFSQTLDSVEYIFIDDCSPDRSVEILHSVLISFPKRKPYVKIIQHQINCGVSKSRQDGLNIASGEYVIHCDPDDWVEYTMYEEMYNHATHNNSDIVICDYILEQNNKSTYIPQRPQTLSSNELLVQLAKGEIYGSLWNKLVRREKIINHNIEFIPGLNVCEDLFFFLQLLKHCVKISYIARQLYHYDFYTNPNSIQRKSLSNHIIQDERIIELSYAILGDYPDARDALICGALFHLFQIQNCTNTEFKHKYIKYKKIILSNNTLHRHYKYFLLGAINGNFTLSRKLFFFLKK